MRDSSSLEEYAHVLDSVCITDLGNILSMSQSQSHPHPDMAGYYHVKGQRIARASEPFLLTSTAGRVILISVFSFPSA